MKAFGRGNIDGEMHVGGKWFRNSLQDAWFVPKAEKNLLSIPSIVDEDMLEVPRIRATSESNEDPEPKSFETKLRDRAKLHKPEKYDAFAMLAADEPNNIEEALASTEAGMWKQAMDEEMQYSFENDT
ncbi:hypothetical protein JTB14_033327 [Gonioctena quinquepunctata]|nr:hypothetical protein JTB14_033327 [Gonioctena quinquepunctata]